MPFGPGSCTTHACEPSEAVAVQPLTSSKSSMGTESPAAGRLLTKKPTTRTASESQTAGLAAGFRVADNRIDLAPPLPQAPQTTWRPSLLYTTCHDTGE